MLKKESHIFHRIVCGWLPNVKSSNTFSICVSAYHCGVLIFKLLTVKSRADVLGKILRLSRRSFASLFAQYTLPHYYVPPLTKDIRPSLTEHGHYNKGCFKKSTKFLQLFVSRLFLTDRRLHSKTSTLLSQDPQFLIKVAVLNYGLFTCFEDRGRDIKITLRWLRTRSKIYKQSKNMLNKWVSWLFKKLHKHWHVITKI